MRNADFFHPTDEFIDKLVGVINERFVVEIGCGNGLVLEQLMKRGVKCIGIDPYVIRDEMSREMSMKILPFETNQAIKMIDEMAKKMDVVLLVVRPCHSGFPQEFLNYTNRDIEMIYVGYVKNLEIDFERDLSLVRFLEFPEHPDCDCVAVLEQGNFNQRVKKEHDWANVDRKVQKMKGEISPDLLSWFNQFKRNRDFHRLKDERIEPLIKAAFPGIERGNSSRTGGEWEEWSDFKLMSRDVTKERGVEFEISTFMVGGGHFACSVKVEDEEFIGLDKKGKIMTGRPWDRIEHRPDWVTRDNLVWYGIRDNKRTINLEAGLIWIKQTYEALAERYKNEIGITLMPELGSGLEYELSTLSRRQDAAKGNMVRLAV